MEIIQSNFIWNAFQASNIDLLKTGAKTQG